MEASGSSTGNPAGCEQPGRVGGWWGAGPRAYSSPRKRLPSWGRDGSEAAWNTELQPDRALTAFSCKVFILSGVNKLDKRSTSVLFNTFSWLHFWPVEKSLLFSFECSVFYSKTTMLDMDILLFLD